MKRFLSFIILGYLALLFNGELYAHSFSALYLLPLVMFYLIFVFVLNLLITKYKFGATKVFLTGSIIGLALETFYSKSIFVEPFFLGVNWLSVVIQFMYWGGCALLPFYVIGIFRRKAANCNMLLNWVIMVYLILEIVLGVAFQYPQTIPIWIISGMVMGIVLAIYLLKGKITVASIN